MTTISLTVSLSLAHQLCTKDRGKTKAALPRTMSSSSTQKSQASSIGLVFCKDARAQPLLMHTTIDKQRKWLQRLVDIDSGFTRMCELPGMGTPVQHAILTG